VVVDSPYGGVKPLGSLSGKMAPHARKASRAFSQVHVSSPGVQSSLSTPQSKQQVLNLASSDQALMLASSGSAAVPVSQHRQALTSQSSSSSSLHPTMLVATKQAAPRMATCATFNVMIGTLLGECCVLSQSK